MGEQAFSQILSDFSPFSNKFSHEIVQGSKKQYSRHFNENKLQ